MENNFYMSIATKYWNDNENKHYSIMYTIITIALQPQLPLTPLLSNYHNKYLHKNIDDNVTEYNYDEDDNSNNTDDIDSNNNNEMMLLIIIETILIIVVLIIIIIMV